MHSSRFIFALLALPWVSWIGAVQAQESPAAPAAEAPKPVYETVPANKDNDLRIFYADGHVLKGGDALGKMNDDANLSLWLAGNQFFAMEDVIHAFQKKHPKMNVAVITLPPGIILNAINKGGWSYQGKDYPMEPDIYASVNLEHLQKLKAKGKMTQYKLYLRNKLEMVVAKGNPKKIKKIDDLARPDLRIMLPNPVTEGIMKFYIKKVLEQHGLWDKISGGKECKSCQATPQTYFTSVHHREIPDALKAGTIDVGIVWASEVQHAKEEGIDLQGVPLPPQDSLVHDAAYAIGALVDAKHAKAASEYLAFLGTPVAQNAYAKHGFIKASKSDLKLRAIP